MGKKAGSRAVLGALVEEMQGGSVLSHIGGASWSQCMNRPSKVDGVGAQTAGAFQASEDDHCPTSWGEGA